MAKKKQKPASSRSSRKKIIWVVVAGVLLVLACFFGIRAFVHHQQTEATYQRDKVRFAATEKDMDAAYAAIVKTVGKPYDEKTNRSCLYSAQKYGNKTLSCSISIHFSYATGSLDRSKKIGSSALTLVDENSMMKRWNFGYDTEGTDNLKGGAYEALYNGSEELSCSLDHEIYTPETYLVNFGVNHFPKASTNFVSVFTFSCGKNTPKALYEIDKSTE